MICFSSNKLVKSKIKFHHRFWIIAKYVYQSKTSQMSLSSIIHIEGGFCARHQLHFMATHILLTILRYWYIGLASWLNSYHFSHLLHPNIEIVIISISNNLNILYLANGGWYCISYIMFDNTWLFHCQAQCSINVGHMCNTILNTSTSLISKKVRHGLRKCDNFPSWCNGSVLSWHKFMFHMTQKHENEILSFKFICIPICFDFTYNFYSCQTKNPQDIICVSHLSNKLRD